MGLVSLTPGPCPARSCGSGALTPDPSVPVQQEMSVSAAERWSRDGGIQSWGLNRPGPQLPLPPVSSGAWPEGPAFLSLLLCFIQTQST